MRSPSVKREWIEIVSVGAAELSLQASPSVKREWIEMGCYIVLAEWKQVSLCKEGVD